MGVKVPVDADAEAGGPAHVMYVWVDALTNYLTGLGWPDETDAFAKYWPANLHLIGKDIVRFHTIYWPAFLMSADLPLPQQVFGHGFLLNRGQKESKSLGNVTDPIELAERFGVDTLRYFFLREVAFGQDGSWSAEAIVTRCNAELANSFGNLVQRVLSMIFKNMGGTLEAFSSTGADDALLTTVRAAAAEDLPREFAALNFSAGIEAWMRAVFACNAYIDEQALDPAQDRSGADARGPAHAVHGHPRPDHRDCPGGADGRRQGARPDRHSGRPARLHRLCPCGLVHGARGHGRGAGAAGRRVPAP
jgi:methionyl-tRNA synthetase